MQFFHLWNFVLYKHVAKEIVFVLLLGLTAVSLSFQKIIFLPFLCDQAYSWVGLGGPDTSSLPVIIGFFKTVVGLYFIIDDPVKTVNSSTEIQSKCVDRSLMFCFLIICYVIIIIIIVFNVSLSFLVFEMNVIIAATLL